MRIRGEKNVFDAALDRIRFIFDEFDEVAVAVSGGKDSTVIFNLAMRVAKERGRLPLTVFWIDQEVEWQATVDWCEAVMTRPDVRPLWFQMPMVITNNASAYERFNYCWREEDKESWTHPKHPVSIKVNRYGTTRFHELFAAIMGVEYAGKRMCWLGGMRAEENPKRFVGLTNAVTYKWVTWGSKPTKNREHYVFHPIYDWTWRDVWKAIQDNQWPYNRVYNAYYQMGVPVMAMRISNLHHETAFQNLLLVQEIEPETWNRVAHRICGANTIKHLGDHAYTCPESLPPMFASWKEYALYLADNLIQEPKHKAALLHYVGLREGVYIHDRIATDFWKKVVDTVLSSDWDFTKIANFECGKWVFGYKAWRAGKKRHANDAKSPYIPRPVGAPKGKHS